jgi:phosphoribosylformylglycinamidine cyclo-ligase
MLPDHLAPRFDRSSWTVPDVFRWLQSEGRVDEDEMHRTFNMGIGLVFAVAPQDVDEVVSELSDLGERPVIIGEVSEK